MLPTGDPLGTVVTMLATPSVVLTVWLSILPALEVGCRPAREARSQLAVGRPVKNYVCCPRNYMLSPELADL